MPIPPLNGDGWLPPGEYSCTLDEVHTAYVARYPGSQTRPAIFTALRRHLEDAEMRAIAMHALVDGSFVSEREDPKDVDLVIGLRPGGLRRALAHPLGVGHIKQISGHFAGRQDGRRLLHIFLGDVGDRYYSRWSQFFQASDRANEPAAKGILLVEIGP